MMVRKKLKVGKNEVLLCDVCCENEAHKWVSVGRKDITICEQCEKAIKSAS